MKRALAVLVASGACAMGLVGLAQPAVAVTVPIDDCDGALNGIVIEFSPGDIGEITFSSCAKTLTLEVGAVASSLGTRGSIGSTSSSASANYEVVSFAPQYIIRLADSMPNVLNGEATYVVYYKYGSASVRSFTVYVSNTPYSPPPASPSSSGAASGSSAPAPTVLLQALDLFGGDWLPSDESSLVGWERTVPLNTWQALPESEDVVGIGENEGKVFLGVATFPDFPVSIAQRQVDNGWGAYETHDGNGGLESVFVPAGGSMFVTSQPRLYSVWGTR